MLSLGVHPHFLSSSLRGVIAQRLIRTLCPACKTTFDLSEAPHTFEEVRPWLEPDQGRLLYVPTGCAECHMTGYAGRTGVFEVLAVNRELRKLIYERQTTQVIRQKAIDDGMIEFKQSALLKVARGETTAEEVLRAVPTEYLGLDD
jgi:general secretion pathway protein E